MQRIDNIKKRIITSIIAIMVLIFALLGITYAYFTTKIKENEDEKSANVSAGKLELTYGDGNGEVVLENIEPGTILKTKTFTVKNTGTNRIDDYDIILENVVNELIYYEDLTYTLTCTSDKNNACKGVENGIFPKYDQILITNSIEKDETQTFELIVTYNETNLDQSMDMNKAIHAKVNIIDKIETVTKLNVYGNTLLTYKDGTNVQTPSNPATITSLGTLITDAKDKYYNKYKVDIIQDSTNLFDISKVTSVTCSNCTSENISNGWKLKGNYGGSTQKDAYSNGWFSPKKGVVGTVYLEAGTTVTISADIKLLKLSDNYTDNNYSNIYLYSVSNTANQTETTNQFLTLNERVRVYQTYFVKKTDNYYPIFTLNNNELEITNIKIEKEPNLWDRDVTKLSDSVTRSAAYTFKASDYDWIKPNIVYYFNANTIVYDDDTRTNPRMSIWIDYQDGTYTYVTKSITKGTKDFVSVKAKANNKAINQIVFRLFDYSSNTEGIWNAYAENISISTNQVNSQYSTYEEPKTISLYLDEPLRCVGKKCDYIDFINSKIVRNVASGILQVKSKRSGYNFWDAYIKEYGGTTKYNSISNGGSAICTHYKTHNGNPSVMEDLSVQPNQDENNYLYLRDDSQTDANTFNKYLVDNKVIVSAVLETPKEEKISLPGSYNFLNKNVYAKDLNLYSSRVEFEQE